MTLVTTLVFVAIQPKAPLPLVSPVFGDHMVLQRGTKAALWGWGPPGQTVEVRGSWGAEVRAKIGLDGKWMARIPTGKAGGPHSVQIELNPEFRSAQPMVELNDILFGDVWICSGQSNMEMTVRKSYPPPLPNQEREIAGATYPLIRSFNVQKKMIESPQDTCGGKWEVCSPETVGNFTATGYFFARTLHQELDVPIGIVHTSWGGTEVELWTSDERLKSIPELAAAANLRMANWLAAKAKGQNAPRPGSLLYNGMIHPLVPMTLKGATWYQGESNVNRASQYRLSFPAMIADWRTRFGQGDFPFYFVQIAPFTGYGDSGAAAELREAQLFTLRHVRNTGMAVTTDITDDLRDIHPINKQDVGKRLAFWALNKAYGRRNVVPSGPLYKSMRIDGNRIRISFDQTAKGLSWLGGAPKGFAIAGPDGKFVAAQAEIQDREVWVSEASVIKPAAVRYGWTESVVGTLQNSAGLPASPFRTDSWPSVTRDAKW